MQISKFSRLGAAVGVAALLIACGAGGDPAEPQKVGEVGASSAATAAPATAKEFKVGDVVEYGDWKVAVRKVTDPLKPGEIFKPDKGKRWVRVEMEVTNKGGEAASFSGLLSVEIQDDQNRPYSLAMTGVDGPELSGNVAPGKSRRGVLDFEVDADSKNLVLNFAPDPLNPNAVTVKLT